jgi:hypothetical protein
LAVEVKESLESLESDFKVAIDELDKQILLLKAKSKIA